MTSLLIELYDCHTIEKNVYQAFVSDCDEILYLSTRKIAEEEKAILEAFSNGTSSTLKTSTFSTISPRKNLPGIRPVYQ